MALDAIETGGILGVVIVMGELIKFAMNKLAERRTTNGHVKLSKELYELIQNTAKGTADLLALAELIRATAQATQQLLEMHSRTDDDGRPKWYFPASVAQNQERTARALERIGRVLDNLERRMEHVEDEQRKMVRCPFAEAPSTVALAPGESGPLPRPVGRRTTTRPGVDPAEES